VRTLAYWALGLGFLVSIAAYSGWLSSLGPSFLSTAIVFGSVAVLGGGAVLGGAWLYDQYRARFPTTEMRDAMVADAAALGLRSVERDVSTLDLRFPLFQKKKGHFLTRSLTAMFASAVRPRVDWIFAGTWRGRDVRIFDYTDEKQNDAQEWTCATLALGESVPSISITRRDFLTGRLERLIDRGFRSGDEGFDRAFHVVTPDARIAIATLGDRARAQLLQSTPPIRGVVEVNASRLLVCGGRIASGDRKLLLDAADAIGEALAPAGH
jgi:hypothetical protein